MAASSSEFLSELAKKPPAHKAAYLAGVLGFIGFFYWQFIYSDLQTQKKKELGTRNRLQKQKKELDKKLTEYDALKKRHAALRSTSDENERALPASPEWGTFIQILQKKAGDAGVRIIKLDTKKEEPAGEYIKVPAAIEITGAFHDVMKFFYLLRPARPRDLITPSPAVKGTQALAKVDRIVNVENLAVSIENEKEPGVLKASFLASTYYRKELPPPPTAAPAPGGKPAPGTKPGAPPGVQRLTNPGAGAPK